MPKYAVKCPTCGLFARVGHRCGVDDHDPDARPLGCNGKYGESGLQQHKRAGTEPCDACRESYRHNRRELRSGRIKPRTPAPCGTYPAAARHAHKGEPLDFACRIARAQYRAELKQRKDAA